ncbi:MAG: hypothetical protein WAK57_01340 [Desulfobacterales bacterium]
MNEYSFIYQGPAGAVKQKFREAGFGFQWLFKTSLNLILGGMQNGIGRNQGHRGPRDIYEFKFIMGASIRPNVCRSRGPAARF